MRNHLWRKWIPALVAAIMLLSALIVPLRVLPAARSSDPAGSGTPQATPTGPPAPVKDNSTPGPQPSGAASVAESDLPRETRALWVSRWDFKEHKDIDAIVDKAAQAHMNVILFQVRGQADALYASSIEPWSADLTGTLGKDPGYDPLAQLVERAHAKGIEVHAWVNTYPAWMGEQAPAADVQPMPMYHDFNARFGNDWLQWKGNKPLLLGDSDYVWANPAHPAVQDRIIAVCKDLMSRYELDGLHLDYIRYAESEPAQDPVSNQAYAAAKAQNPDLTREDWQRAQVTTLVQRVRDEAVSLRPGAHLTTTAWPAYKDRWGWYKGQDGYNARYQDSQTWAREGIVDAIMPMIYGQTATAYRDRFEALAQDYVQGSQPGGAVPGITTEYDSFEEITARIETARRLGARGQALFSFRGLEEHNYWQALGEGPYAQPAQPNWG